MRWRRSSTGQESIVFPEIAVIIRSKGWKVIFLCFGT
jgi:hypothetical protein